MFRRVGRGVSSLPGNPPFRLFSGRGSSSGARTFAPTNNDIVEDREPQELLIRRRNNAMSPTGIYRCDIETAAVNDNDADTITGETVYIGLYLPSEGIYMC